MKSSVKSQALEVLSKMLTLLGPEGEKFSSGKDSAVDGEGVPCVVDGRFACKWSLYGAFTRCVSFNRIEVWGEIKANMPMVSPQSGLDAVSALKVAQASIQKDLVCLEGA